MHGLTLVLSCYWTCSSLFVHERAVYHKLTEVVCWSALMSRKQSWSLSTKTALLLQRAKRLLQHHPAETVGAPKVLGAVVQKKEGMQFICYSLYELIMHYLTAINAYLFSIPLPFSFPTRKVNDCKTLVFFPTEVSSLL